RRHARVSGLGWQGQMGSHRLCQCWDRRVWLGCLEHSLAHAVYPGSMRGRGRSSHCASCLAASLASSRSHLPRTTYTMGQVYTKHSMLGEGCAEVPVASALCSPGN